MVRDPFVTGVSPGRMHLSLRTLAANDNVPLGATEPPRRADGGASTRWPLLNRIGAIAATRGEGTSSLARHDAQDANDTPQPSGPQRGTENRVLLRRARP